MAISFAKLHVLDPSRLARRLLWHVLSIGVVSRDEPEEHAGMDKAGLFLFRVISGRGTLELPHERHELKRGASWWLLDLARSRRYVPSAGTRLVTAGVRFSGPGVDAWRAETFGGRAGFPLSSSRHSGQLRKAADELMELASRTPADSEWRMHEIVTSVLGVVLEARDLLNAKPPEAHSTRYFRSRSTPSRSSAPPLQDRAPIRGDLQAVRFPSSPKAERIRFMDRCMNTIATRRWLPTTGFRIEPAFLVKS